MTKQCPKSVISAQSLNFLEQFRVWQAFEGGTPWDLDARAAEAILLLRDAWRKERERGQN